MKHLLTLLLLALATFPSVAQISHTKDGTVDENAQRVLKSAQNKISKGTVSFTVTMINRNTDKKETARQEATVIYSKGRYRVELDRQVLYCDGTSVWHWNKDAGEVTINPLSEDSDDLINPAQLLANYKKNFREKYIRLEDDGTAVVDLTPKKGKSYHKIRLLINEKTGVLKSLELHNYDGSRGEYRISNFKTGVKSTDKDFSFDQHANPAVEVIDMR